MPPSGVRSLMMLQHPHCPSSWFIIIMGSNCWPCYSFRLCGLAWAWVVLFRFRSIWASNPGLYMCTAWSEVMPSIMAWNEWYAPFLSFQLIYCSTLDEVMHDLGMATVAALLLCVASMDLLQPWGDQVYMHCSSCSINDLSRVFWTGERILSDLTGGPQNQADYRTLIKIDLSVRYRL